MDTAAGRHVLQSSHPSNTSRCLFASCYQGQAGKQLRPAQAHQSERIQLINTADLCTSTLNVGKTSAL